VKERAMRELTEDEKRVPTLRIELKDGSFRWIPYLVVQGTKQMVILEQDLLKLGIKLAWTLNKELPTD
jgi:hypothetical protein